MKKKILASILAATMVLGLTACGAQEVTDAANTAADAVADNADAIADAANEAADAVADAAATTPN